VIQRVRIDDAMWDAAHRRRRHDWRVSIVDVVDGQLGHTSDHLLYVGLNDHAVWLTTFDELGAPNETYEITHSQLRKQVDEYLAIIRRIEASDEHDFSSVMHALDMGKKVVHDAGARTLARALPGFAPNHEAYRRLFSLILSLIVDVTALTKSRGHRTKTK
jgi:uncharacterized protein (UPF0262 family)